jgi:hypothetical protein
MILNSAAHNQDTRYIFLLCRILMIFMNLEGWQASKKLRSYYARPLKGIYCAKPGGPSS